MYNTFICILLILNIICFEGIYGTPFYRTQFCDFITHFSMCERSAIENRLCNILLLN